MGYLTVPTNLFLIYQPSDYLDNHMYMVVKLLQRFMEKELFCCSNDLQTNESLIGFFEYLKYLICEVLRWC